MKASQSALWFNYVRRSSRPRLRLICLSGAGAGPSSFISWHAALDDSIEIWPVQLPGREQRIRETPWSSLTEIVSALYDAVIAINADFALPLVLFGHSFGSLVMYELCQRFLSKDSNFVRGLIISAMSAPIPQNCSRPLSKLSDERLLAWVRQIGGTPETLLSNPKFVLWLLRDLRAAQQIREAYQPDCTSVLSCRLSVFGGVDDSEASVGGLHAWSQFTSVQFHCHILPGGHFFLRQESQHFLALLAQELDAV
jgi:medium-chain acyl-[acyl-carrier-protein] hydrolase